MDSCFSCKKASSVFLDLICTHNVCVSCANERLEAQPIKTKELLICGECAQTTVLDSKQKETLFKNEIKQEPPSDLAPVGLSSKTKELAGSKSLLNATRSLEKLIKDLTSVSQSLKTIQATSSTLLDQEAYDHLGHLEKLTQKTLEMLKSSQLAQEAKKTMEFFQEKVSSICKNNEDSHFKERRSAPRYKKPTPNNSKKEGAFQKEPENPSPLTIMTDRSSYDKKDSLNPSPFFPSSKQFISQNIDPEPPFPLHSQRQSSNHSVSNENSNPNKDQPKYEAKWLSSIRYSETPSATDSHYGKATKGRLNVGEVQTRLEHLKKIQKELMSNELQNQRRKRSRPSSFENSNSFLVENQQKELNEGFFGVPAGPSTNFRTTGENLEKKTQNKEEMVENDQQKHMKNQREKRQEPPTKEILTFSGMSWFPQKGQVAQSNQGNVSESALFEAKLGKYERTGSPPTLKRSYDKGGNEKLFMTSQMHSMKFGSPQCPKKHFERLENDSEFKVFRPKVMQHGHGASQSQKGKMIEEAKGGQNALMRTSKMFPGYSNWSPQDGGMNWNKVKFQQKTFENGRIKPQYSNADIKELC